MSCGVAQLIASSTFPIVNHVLVNRQETPVAITERSKATAHKARRRPGARSRKQNAETAPRSEKPTKL
jgi:hypothetical protein